VTAVAAEPASFRHGTPGFLALCERIGFPTEPFQRRIATAYRIWLGNGKRLM